MKFILFYYPGIYWWFTIFIATTFIAKVKIDALKMFRFRHLPEKAYRRKCSLVLSSWLGINLFIVIYFADQVMTFRQGG